MYRLLVLATCLAYVLSSPLEKKDSVKLTVFYESYCPYSIDFIDKQLYGAWNYFKKHLQVDLVPFGNAEQSYDKGHFVFTCQHGPKECVGNILHSCAIYEACGKKGTLHCPVPKLKKALNYIDCVIDQEDQQKASDKCATKAGLEPKVINKCAKGKLGEWLESGYGNQTKAFDNPPVTYVPFIVVNGKHTDKIQDEAQTDLKALICTYIPDQCKK
ncbi:gamma-interferon-inducible lysosomal thiol reductase-like [Homalodisca vitripennis]|uniref:gamma-interferon-inducible lysosomal thiol reductase-like n=1 Tax=Homalodisca vitripennis TaxID=197043 RepID=UPI001EEBD675|nr:gamma-interferon-inducible lysosomal thiol reductase-like [Homalodisca vitripennis]